MRERLQSMKYTSKHATIIDIAKKLGISPSTVSRALSDHP
ncbi:MAG: helix-turn-helix domain-containing protein, partial [Bacteroidota bacterium]